MSNLHKFSKTLLSIFIISAVSGIIFYIVSKNYPFLRFFFEDNPPELTLLKVPKGIGKEPQTFKLLIEDKESGLELIRIRAEQSSNNISILDSKYSFNTFSKEIEFDIYPQKIGLKKGKINLVIEAYDRSLASNGLRHSIELPVSFDAPDIEILSSQHNAVRTGMEFVIYRVKSDEISSTGVRVGEQIFKGIPAELYDPDLQGISDLYFAFFALPMDYDQNNNPPVVFAFNEVGNKSEETFYYRIKNRNRDVSRYDVNNIEETSFPGLENVISKIKEIKFSLKKSWDGPFVKPAGVEQSPKVGDLIRVTDSTNESSYSFNNQVLFYKTSKDQFIKPVNNGKIISMSDEPGLGKYILIDHGFGFISLYAGLSEILPQDEEMVSNEDAIGKSGYLGHLNSNGFIFGLFFQGQAVRLQEWTDSTWVSDHILAKIRELKVRFNIQEVIPDVTREKLQGSIISDRIVEKRNKRTIDSINRDNRETKEKPKADHYHQNLDF